MSGAAPGPENAHGAPLDAARGAMGNVLAAGAPAPAAAARAPAALAPDAAVARHARARVRCLLESEVRVRGRARARAPARARAEHAAAPAPAPAPAPAAQTCPSAVRARDLAALELLLADGGAAAAAACARGFGVLVAAATAGWAEGVAACLARGARVDERVSARAAGAAAELAGFTPLLIVAALGGEFSCVLGRPVEA